jgi:sporulation protein YabP
MDKMDTVITSLTHSVSINERKNIIITGVKKIDSFDENEFFLETTLGNLIIKGSELEIIKLDTYQGNVSIKGHVDNLHYTEDKDKSKDEGLFGKLFK